MLTALRVASFLEGLSFIILLGIAMPLKYWLDKPFLVPYAGMFHGVMFIVFVVVLIVACHIYRWPISVLLIGLVVSVVPFMPFWFERYVVRLADDEYLSV